MTKVMKLVILLVIVTPALGLICNMTAGEGRAGGAGQSGSGIIASGSQLPSGISPGLNANNNLASQSSAPSQTGSAPTSGNPGTSTAGPNTSQNGYAAGSSNGTSSNVPTAVDLKKEKVVEVSVNDLEAEQTKNHETGEVTKKFESSILNTGV